MDRKTERKGIHRGLRASLILGLTLVTPLIPVSTALNSSASASSVTRVTLIGTYEFCDLAPPTTTTVPTTITTGPVTAATVPNLPPYFVNVGIPPMDITLTQRGHVVAQTGNVKVSYPAGYLSTYHPQGPSGFDARYELHAPPGTYVLRAFTARPVTLVAGRITRVDVRQGNCW